MRASPPIATWWSARARSLGHPATPLIADADTGFGGLINVRADRARLRGRGRAGDPDRGPGDAEEMRPHAGPARRSPRADMCRKIEVAVDARGATDTLIIARTDARTGLGLDEAIAPRPGLRARPAPTSSSSNRRRARTSSSASATRSTPGCSPTWCRPASRRWCRAARLKPYGFDIAIYPVGRHVGRLRGAGGELRVSQGSRLDRGSPVPAYTMAQLHELMGFPDVWEFEKRFAEP